MDKRELLKELGWSEELVRVFEEPQDEPIAELIDAAQPPTTDESTDAAVTTTGLSDGTSLNLIGN